jgi:hypothetical protein
VLKVREHKTKPVSVLMALQGVTSAIPSQLTPFSILLHSALQHCAGTPSFQCECPETAPRLRQDIYFPFSVTTQYELEIVAACGPKQGHSPNAMPFCKIFTRAIESGGAPCRDTHSPSPRTPFTINEDIEGRRWHSGTCHRASCH